MMLSRAARPALKAGMAAAAARYAPTTLGSFSRAPGNLHCGLNCIAHCIKR
jgi:hypothetical protein